MRRLIDISVPLENSATSDPPEMRPDITYLDHHQTAPQMAAFMGVSVDDLPEGQYAGVERCTGTDAWSWDAPFIHTRERVRQTGDAGLIWEGHRAGRDIGYCQMEKLHDLELLPPDGFTVVCFPVKVRDASAGWTRAVAILENTGD